MIQSPTGQCSLKIINLQTSKTYLPAFFRLPLTLKIIISYYRDQIHIITDVTGDYTITDISK